MDDEIVDGVRSGNHPTAKGLRYQTATQCCVRRVARISSSGLGRVARAKPPYTRIDLSRVARMSTAVPRVGRRSLRGRRTVSFMRSARRGSRGASRMCIGEIPMDRGVRRTQDGRVTVAVVGDAVGRTGSRGRRRTGKTVVVRFDPRDVRAVAFYDESGRFVGHARWSLRRLSEPSRGGHSNVDREARDDRAPA